MDGATIRRVRLELLFFGGVQPWSRQRGYIVQFRTCSLLVLVRFLVVVLGLVGVEFVLRLMSATSCNCLVIENLPMVRPCVLSKKTLLPNRHLQLL